MLKKECSRCLREQPLDNFYFHKSYGYRRGQCKTCVKAVTDAWRNRNREFHLKNGRDKQNARSLALRKAVLTHYSKGIPQCACCGVYDLVFLTIDRMKKSGAQHRAEIGKNMKDKRNVSSVRVYYDIVKNKFPKGYQVLCFNCNFASHRGVCPHKLVKKCL